MFFNQNLATVHNGINKKGGFFFGIWKSNDMTVDSNRFELLFGVKS